MTNPTPDPGFTSTHECPHGAYELRKRTYANGVVHFVYQCVWCGASGRSIKKEQALALGGADASTFDDGLRDRYWEEARRQRDSLYEDEHGKRQAEYQAYLRSPTWRRKRERRLAMDRWQCQARLGGCTGTATEIHHLTYAHKFDEPLFDLVSVCGECHERISRMDGQIREGGTVYDLASD